MLNLFFNALDSFLNKSLFEANVMEIDTKITIIFFIMSPLRYMTN